MAGLLHLPVKRRSVTPAGTIRLLFYGNSAASTLVAGVQTNRFFSAIASGKDIHDRNLPGTSYCMVKKYDRSGGAS